ncbi:hypothetical protein K435DRAFT_782831 [Dendrothele bispora CBS 962.96]|uniref:C2H2-type domain-containing protein n=1 Tax=Dendrothele bispora (strain CBS 962.96) TaxID=1314807 RepID=A0A4S8LCT6_DENBC|nr:hypothetical protein K435DRAFT_782831 [Dendrothele bispora CBS 962.96]
MSITLPIEEMARLRLSLKLGVDGRLTFDMQPVERSLSTSQWKLQNRNLKLRFEGKSDAKGFLCLDVWVEDEEVTSATNSASSMNAESSTSFGSNGSHFHNAFSAPGDQVHEEGDSVSDFSMFDTVSSTSPFPHPYENLPWPSSIDVAHFISSFNFQESPISTPSASSETTNVFEMLSPQDLSSPLPSTSSLPSNGTLHPHLLTTKGSSNFDGTSFTADNSPESEPPEDIPVPSFSSAERDPPETVNNNVARPWPCLEPGCLKHFTRKYTRSVHMETHTRAKQERKLFPCRVAGCDEHFGRKHDRLRHEAGIHSVECDWMCAECSRVFSSETTLEKHLTSSGHSNHR